MEDLFGPDDAYLKEVFPQFKTLNYTSNYSGLRFSLRLLNKHNLWGHLLWNGAKWTAEYLQMHPELVEGKRVLELGAGAGLPSVIAANLKASKVNCKHFIINHLFWTLSCF